MGRSDMDVPFANWHPYIGQYDVDLLSLVYRRFANTTAYEGGCTDFSYIVSTVVFSTILLKMDLWDEEVHAV
jgi:hypothetical protein